MEQAEWECKECSADNQVCQCYLNEVTERVQELEQENRGLGERIKELEGFLRYTKEDITESLGNRRFISVAGWEERLKRINELLEEQ